MDTQNQSIIQTIFARHSIRSYLFKNIDKDTIHVLLQCAVRAPNNGPLLVMWFCLLANIEFTCYA
jgi:nitroreductase